MRERHPKIPADENTVMVRMPRKLIDYLRELRDKEGLSSIGNAMQFYIQQQKDEKMDGKIIELRELIDELGNSILEATKVITKKVKDIEECLGVLSSLIWIILLSDPKLKNIVKDFQEAMFKREKTFYPILKGIEKLATSFNAIKLAEENPEFEEELNEIIK